MIVTVDANSGYCFGVEFAIQMAEDELNDSGELYCLGDIATWWSYTEYRSEIAWNLQLHNCYDGLIMNIHHEKINAHFLDVNAVF